MFIIFSPASAQPNGIAIDADDLSYDRENNLLEARGSVEVVYKDVIVKGAHISYDTGREVVFAKDGFIIYYGGLTIEGEALDYKIREKTGQVKDFRFNYENIELSGGEMTFGEEEYLLRNAAFTTCDAAYPHYRVTAREISLNPAHGWLVAYWGIFWLNRIPIVPVPTYIYDVRAEQRGERNLPPFPEISSNEEDGIFINERLAWHLRREFSGTYSLNFAEKKGFGAGVEANYLLSEVNHGNLRLYGNLADGLWGGATHRLDLGEVIEADPEGPFGFFARPVYREYEFIFELTHRERINYQRVSYYPRLTLKKNRDRLFADSLKYELASSAGKIEEEGNPGLYQAAGEGKLSWEWPENAIGEITPNLGMDARFYSNGNKWIVSTGGIDLRRNLFDFISLGLGYLRYLSVEGASPFNYEIYRFNANDRLLSEIFFMFEETGIGVNASYFTGDWSPEDIDYSLFLKLHCYNLVVQYRSLRNEFSLGVSLAGGN